MSTSDFLAHSNLQELSWDSTCVKSDENTAILLSLFIGTPSASENVYKAVTPQHTYFPYGNKWIIDYNSGQWTTSKGILNRNTLILQIRVKPYTLEITLKGRSNFRKIMGTRFIKR